MANKAVFCIAKSEPQAERIDLKLPGVCLYPTNRCFDVFNGGRIAMLRRQPIVDRKPRETSSGKSCEERIDASCLVTAGPTTTMHE